MNAAPAISGAATVARENNSQPDYFRSVIPDPVCILGLKLKPLSLGHYRLLKRFDSPFVAEGDARAGLDDLLLAVLICSLHPDEFIAWCGSPDFQKEVAAWGSRVSPIPWYAKTRLTFALWDASFLSKRWREKRSFNVIGKIQMFQNYLQTAQAIPHYSSKSQAQTDSNAHWSHSIEIGLRVELGWTANEINEQPLSKAIADFFEHLQRQGVIMLLTDEDFAQADHNTARIEAAMKAAGLMEKPGDN